MVIVERGRARPLDVSPALVEMWRNNLRKSSRVQANDKPQIDLPASINIVFDGAGVSPVAGLAGLIEVRFPCRIIGCSIYAGNIFLQPAEVTATIDLRLGRTGFWVNGSSPLYMSGIPQIVAASEATVDISQWIVDLQPGDLIPYVLLTFDGALATWLAMTISLQRLDVVGTNTAVITDSFSDTITTSSGEEVVLRG